MFFNFYTNLRSYIIKEKKTSAKKRASSSKVHKSSKKPYSNALSSDDIESRNRRKLKKTTNMFQFKMFKCLLQRWTTHKIWRLK